MDPWEAEEEAIEAAVEAAYEEDGSTPLDLIEEFDLGPEEIYDDAY